MNGLGYSYAVVCAGRLEGHAQPHSESGPALRVASADPRDSLQHGRLRARLQRHRTSTASRSTARWWCRTRRPSHIASHAVCRRHCAHADPDRCAGRDSRGAALIPTRPIGVRAWALPGGPSATTRPSFAAAGDVSSRRRSASRWSPAGPSHASYVATYNQDYDASGVTPLLSFANPFNTAAGSASGTATSTTPFPSTTKTRPCSSGT